MTPLRIKLKPEPTLKIRLTPETAGPRWWSLHTHSKFSASDAFPTPAAIVARAKELGYKGLGITDHGNMSASIELYRECQKAGIKPFPGTELYFVPDRTVKKNQGRHHLCMAAYTTQGYRNLIKISTDTYKNFYYKPLVDFADLARYHEQGWSEGIALTTGCYFGYTIQTLVKEGYEAARNVVATMAKWFDVYVEIQNHRIDHGHDGHDWNEVHIAVALRRIARELDLPVILTQDSHYIDCNDRTDHDTMKSLISFGTGDDALFPGDGFHMADDAWIRDHHSDVAGLWEQGVAGLDRLLAKHDLRIDEVDNYRYRVPVIEAEPDTILRQRCFRELRGRKGDKTEYSRRLDEELKVIEASRMGNYMLLVALVCDYMRREHIHFQTRGSAAGSLVCWLLNITNFDPIEWECRFDRFLSKDRTKPPDIDLDVESLRRLDVMDWISQRFSINQVCTWGTLGIKPEERGSDTQKGSLLQKYYAKRRARIVEAGGASPEDGWHTIPREDQQRIVSLNDREAYSNPGTHTCALLLTNSRDEQELMVPMMRIGGGDGGTWVTQYDGKTIESIGLIKLDLLGSATMSILRQCADNLGREVEPMLNAIPLTDSHTYAMISRGDTEGCFQIEGGTTQRGCKDSKPRKIQEVIDIMALYRPAVMNVKEDKAYVRRKFGEERMPTRHELIARHTDFTRGILLYQDQVIAILRELGLQPEDMTKLLKAIKASNKNVTEAQRTMDEYMPRLKAAAAELGFTDADWQWFQGALDAASNYGFNRAHATVYGLAAYRCAWLALNEPAAFHAALLAINAGQDKEEKYLRVARRRGVKIKGVDINTSKEVYALDGQSVRKGFLSVDSIGGAIAPDLVSGQPYTDWEGFVEHAIGSKITGVKPFRPNQTSPEQLVGTVKALHSVGAFRDSFALPFGEGYVPKKRKKKDDQADSV